MKVYTKTGDQGTTALIGGERVFKTDERVEAYGTVDELSAFVALLADRLQEREQAAEQIEELRRISARLMSIEALLARGSSGCEKVAPLDIEQITWLEERIDAMQVALPTITKFTLIGGNPAVSLCHVCRTICRRAERAALRVDQKYGTDVTVLAYLNRLSDYFYLLSRYLTQLLGVEEILWIP